MARVGPLVRILLFASAREAVGQREISWPLPPEGMTAQRLLAVLGEEYPKLRPTLSVSRFVRNGRYLDDLGTSLRAGDEFAVHPPYGGG